MANGDIAAAAGIAVVDGTTADFRLGYDEINKTRDEVAKDRTATRSVARGGTGATTAAAARTSLGAASAADLTALQTTVASMAPQAALNAALADIDDITADVGSATSAATGGKLIRRDSAGRASVGTPVASGHATTKAYVDAAVDAAYRSSVNGLNGGTIQSSTTILGDLVVSLVISNLYARNNPVSTSYVACYINSDGRFGATPSALRFKQDIESRTYTLAQLELMRVVIYRLRTAVEVLGDAAGYEVGVIAEELEAAGLGEFVHYDEQGRTLSVAYERLVLVVIGAVQELAANYRALEERVTALESKGNA